MPFWKKKIQFSFKLFEFQKLSRQELFISENTKNIENVFFFINNRTFDNMVIYLFYVIKKRKRSIFMQKTV